MSIEDEVRAIVAPLAWGLDMPVTTAENVDKAVAALMRLMEPKLTAEQVAEAEHLRQIMLDTVDEYERKQKGGEMKLTVTADYVTVVVMAPTGFGVQLDYTNSHGQGDDPPYRVQANADSVDELRALIACAEPEGSPTRLAVENVLKRTSDLMDEWVAEVNAK